MEGIAYCPHSYATCLVLPQARYWRCARTASELRRDMHYQLAPSLRPWTLLAYWTMNEGLGQCVPRAPQPLVD